MNKYTFIGIFALVGAGLFLIFQAIASMATAGEIVWKDISLISAVGADRFEFIHRISWQLGQHALNYVVNLPVYVLLLAAGVIFLIIGGATSK